MASGQYPTTRDLPLLLEAAAGPAVRCPGEAYDISWKIHLARRAQGYDRCPSCPHREQLRSDQLKAGLPRPENDAFRDLFGAEGVRGVYLNQLSRSTAVTIAIAYASLLRNQLTAKTNTTAQNDSTTQDDSTAESRSPLVVLGHDERPVAPDIAAGVNVGLRRAGCRVVDVGLVSRPTLWSAQQRINAAGTIYVTGAGADLSRIGLDLTSSMEQGVPLPWTGADRLPELFDLLQPSTSAGTTQPAQKSAVSRGQGSYRSERPLIDYLQTLQPEFHALRPLRLVVGSSSRHLLQCVRRLLQPLALFVTERHLPVRSTPIEQNEAGWNHPGIADLGELVRQQQAHLGIWLSEDGCGCGLIDEQGRLRTAAELLALLRCHAASVRSADETGSRSIAFSASHDHAAAEPASEPDRVGAEQCRGISQGCWSEIAKQAASHAGQILSDLHGRVWFHEEQVRCDALLTLARVLQACSQSDEELSTLCEQALRNRPLTADDSTRVGSIVGASAAEPASPVAA